VSEPPHEVDEGDSKKERPRYLYEEESEIDGSADEGDENRVNR